MKESWRKQMQQKMEGYEQPAPEMAWDDIEQAVNAGMPKLKPILIWGRRVAAAILVLLITVAGYKAFVGEEKPMAVQQKTGHREKVSPKIEGESLTENTNSATEDNLQSSTPTFPKRSIKKQLARKSQTDHSHMLLATTTENSIATIEQSGATDTTALALVDKEEETEDQPSSRQQNLTSAEINYPQTIYPSDLHKTSQRNGRLMAKVYLSNTFANDGLGNESGKEFYGLPYADAPIPPYDEKGEQNPYIGNKAGNEGKTDDKPSEVSHHQPIRLGLSLRYRLNDRWSLESGMTYTRLVSDIVYSTNLTSISKEQTLHYIGIPLQVNYLLWNNRHFDLYASMGGMVEKMVSGRQTSTTSSEHLSIRPLQWSLSGSLGAAYKLSHLFSIYAEPGLNYYFDNGSSIPTLYQEKPFNFSISLGLRFEFR